MALLSPAGGGGGVCDMCGTYASTDAIGVGKVHADLDIGRLPNITTP